MRNASELATIDGMKYIASVPNGELIIAMVVRDGKLFIATEHHLYTLEGGKRLEPTDPWDPLFWGNPL